MAAARVRLKDGIDEKKITPELAAEQAVHMWLKHSRQTHQLEEIIAGLIRWERDRCARTAEGAGAEQVGRLIRNLPGGAEDQPKQSPLILPPGFASPSKH